MSMDKKIAILIVDDYAGMRRTIRNILKKVGYDNIIEAEDGVTAMRAIKAQKVDFVIADWNMPKMTGLELLKAIRADTESSSLPFLMVTAEAAEENVIAAFKAGVSNYIVKPFTGEVLIRKIAAVMAKYG